MFIFSGRTNKELAAIRQLLEQVNNKVDQVEEQELKIMSQITDWAAAEQADLSTIQATLNGIVTGITALDTLITNLQATATTLSPDDLAALTAVKTASDLLVTQSQAISTTAPGAPTPAPVASASNKRMGNVG